MNKAELKQAVLDGKTYDPEVLDALIDLGSRALEDVKPTDEPENKYPDLPVYVVRGLELEGQLDVLEKPWCAILTTEDNEFDGHGHDTYESLKKDAESGEYEEGGWYLDLIVHEGKPVPFKLEVKRTLTITEKS